MNLRKGLELLLENPNTNKIIIKPAEGVFPSTYDLFYNLTRFKPHETFCFNNNQ